MTDFFDTYIKKYILVILCIQKALRELELKENWIDPFTPEECISGILNYPFSCALLGVGTFEQVETAFAKEYEPHDYTLPV